MSPFTELRRSVLSPGILRRGQLTPIHQPRIACSVSRGFTRIFLTHIPSASKDSHHTLCEALTDPAATSATGDTPHQRLANEPLRHRLKA